MITKKSLKQIAGRKKEILYLEKKIENIENKPIKIVTDSVSGNSSEFPYTSHNFKIEGFETPKNLKKYKKLLKESKYKLEKTIINLEYELKKIDDSNLCMIIRYKYIEGMNYIQIAHEMNKNPDRSQKNKLYTDESVRKQLERFFEKK